MSPDFFEQLAAGVIVGGSMLVIMYIMIKVCEFAERKLDQSTE